MNLLLVDAVDFPFGGAHSVHVNLLMKGLRENNTNASLIIPYGRKREALSANNKKYGHFDGIPYCFVRYSKSIIKGFRFLDIFIGAMHTAALLRKRKKKKKLDAVILGGLPDILRDSPIIITCAIFRIPIYFWLVEKASLSEDYRGIVGYLNKKSQQLTEWGLSKFASGVIVISTSLKNHYLKYLSEKQILINPILVSESTHDSINRQSVNVVKEKMQHVFKGKRLLVYSGSFGEKDGIFYLIDAFGEVIKTYPDTVFVMTGKNYSEAFMDKIRVYIKERHLEEKIQLPGFVNADELLCYNMLADILLACRSNSPFANHGFPWKLGEYCMTERPIIATRVSDIEKYFVNNESLFIVPPNDPGTIAEKVKYVFSDYSNALAVAKRGKQIALKEFGYFEKAVDVVNFIMANNKTNN
jgi:glycosyltransferase involved in cell wall biosynthesis